MWLVPSTRASSDGVDDSDSGEWIHLKRGIDIKGCGQSVYVDTASCSAVGFELDNKIGPRAYLCLAGIDYEKPELGSDGLVLGIRTLSVEPHCFITYSFKFEE
ncbi:hypothetical protein M9H77_21993 [Catharanthus roseus]|uniref:Uncharacterized protein n=1 Tax=Catharanthus roseus TaxID=4058 RepID=A0ACC0AQN8_CATRO|nr:hypothetical protein M9H77_21993 [Catharanthus roseus]